MLKNKCLNDGFVCLDSARWQSTLESNQQTRHANVTFLGCILADHTKMWKGAPVLESNSATPDVLQQSVGISTSTSFDHFKFWTYMRSLFMICHDENSLAFEFQINLAIGRGLAKTCRSCSHVAALDDRINRGHMLVFAQKTSS